MRFGFCCWTAGNGCLSVTSGSPHSRERESLCEFSLRSKEPVVMGVRFLIAVCVHGVCVDAGGGDRYASGGREACLCAAFRFKACTCAAIVVGRVLCFCFFTAALLAYDSWLVSPGAEWCDVPTLCTLFQSSLTVPLPFFHKCGRRKDGGDFVKICMNCFIVDCDLRLSSPKKYSLFFLFFFFFSQFD